MPNMPNNEHEETVTSDRRDYIEKSEAGQSYACLIIEQKYALDGFPPQVVIDALERHAKGEDMHDILNDIVGPNYED